MKLELQVTSIELSKRLKELGVKQESLFYWLRNEFLIEENFNICASDKINLNSGEKYSAFTASELLELVPVIEGASVQFKLLKMCSIIEGIYYLCRCELLAYDNSIFLDKNSADACAKALIYILENNVLEIK